MPVTVTFTSGRTSNDSSKPGQNSWTGRFNRGLRSGHAGHRATSSLTVDPEHPTGGATVPTPPGTSSRRSTAQPVRAGMVEDRTGVAGRYNQAHLVSEFIDAGPANPVRADEMCVGIQGPKPTSPATTIASSDRLSVLCSEQGRLPAQIHRAPGDLRMSLAFSPRWPSAFRAKTSTA